MEVPQIFELGKTFAQGHDARGSRSVRNVRERWVHLAHHTKFHHLSGWESGCLCTERFTLGDSLSSYVRYSYDAKETGDPNST